MFSEEVAHIVPPEGPPVREQRWEELSGVEFGDTQISVRSEAMDESQRSSPSHASKSPFQWHLFLLFLSLRFSDPQALLCHRDAVSDTATEPCDQPRSVKSRKYQVKSRRPEQWSKAEHQQPSRQDCWTVRDNILWLHRTE